MKNERVTQYFLLVIFLLCGGWAGSIIAFAASSQDETYHTAELALGSQEAGLIFNRDRGDGGGKSTPYVEPAPAPEFAPVPEGMEFPAPVNADPIVAPQGVPVVPPSAPPVVVAPPVAVDPGKAEDNPLTTALGSLTKLFNGEADFSDIIKLGIAAFAVFGGAQLGGSDILFKTILGLFSKKTNFYAILKENVDLDTNRRLLSKLKKK